MTNDEIRLKIAELKGWQTRTRSWVDKRHPHAPDVIVNEFEYLSDHGWFGVPFFSTDIRAAWELVEEMADDGDLFIESWQDGEWFIANHPLGIQPRALAHCDGRETGKRNICRAVCLAYIAWKEQGK